MARTQIDRRILKNRDLTGASFSSELNIYDETKNYPLDYIVFWKGDKYKSNVSITSSTLEGDLSNAPDVSGDWDLLKPAIYSLYPSTEQTFSNASSTLLFDTVRYDSLPGIFSIASGEITANTTGTFLFNLTVTYDNTTTTRDSVYTNLEINTGSGWTIVNNYELSNYSRTTDDGRGTSSLTIPLDINNGDKLRIQMIGRTTSTLKTVPPGCNITIFPILSVSGPQGEQGPAGPSGDIRWLGVYDNSTSYVDRDAVEYQGSTFVSTGNTTGVNPGDPDTPTTPWELVAKKGADGSGATITLSDDGTNINNTPHSVLNFIGPEISASDAGSGVADISITLPKNTYMNSIWAEENAALADNTYEWAFGNGANTPNGNGVSIYVPSGYKCELVAMSLCLRQGTATVEALKNTTLLGTNANVSVSSGQSNTNEFTPIEYIDKDIINFRTTTASGTGGPNVVTAWFKYTEL